MNRIIKIAVGCFAMTTVVSCTTRGEPANDAAPASKPAVTVTATTKPAPSSPAPTPTRSSMSSPPATPRPTESEPPTVCASCHSHEPLALGSRGLRVSNLQGSLALLGYYTAAIDGSFGPLTDAAVRAFQTDYGLVVDGVFGPQTEDALSEVLADNH